MKELVETSQYAIMVAGVAVLLLMGMLAIAWRMRGVAGALRRFFGMCGLAGFLVAFCVWYGGGKSITFDTGLRDNGSWASNNTVHVSWTYIGIPSASSVYIAYRETNTTNAWEDLGETVASALVWEATVQNATNYDYLVYSTYVPPSPVHTNGVWQGPVYETKKRVGANSFVVIGAEVREHGCTIAPPYAKRHPYDTEVEWLSNNGGAYIDTGVKGSQVRGVRARYMVTSFASYGPLFNCYNGEEYDAVRLISQSSNNGQGYASLNTRARGSLVIPLSLNTWYDYRASVESGVFRATVNETDYTIAAAAGTANTKNVTLFGTLGARVSAFALYGADGKAVIDLIPVRRDGVGYMFDRVSLRLFGNASSGGSFGIGPKKN